MLHFISAYNYDFALASLPIQAILLVFYVARRNLPIRRSGSFLLVMLLNLGMTSFDLLSCEMNEIWTRYPLWLMYAVNMGYFLCFILRGWALFDYTAEACKAFKIIPIGLRWLSWSVAGLMVAVILSTPWTGAIFRIDPAEGYYNCGIYDSIYCVTWYHIFLSLAFVFLCRKQTPVRTLLAMVAYNLILILGIVLRRQFINTLVTSYFSILAVLTIYLSTQNPDIYRERRNGLFNRDAFDEIVDAYIIREIPFRCMAITVSEYNTLHSLYGHEQMSRFARLLGNWLRGEYKEYFTFYFGGGSYIMLQRLNKHRPAEGTSPEDLNLAVMERFSRPWQADGVEVSASCCTASLPVWVRKRSADDTADCLMRALHEAASHGSGTYYVIDEDMLSRMAREDAVDRALGRAFANHSFEVYLQPIYDVRSGRVTAAEALARLRDPELGAIPPPEFVRAAERDGSIIRLGEEIFSKTCEFIASHDMDALGITHINVNMSPAQCLYEDLAEDLIRIAGEYGVPLHRIGLEITETDMEDLTVLRRQMNRLWEEGVRFALDDFGTGTSNLTRLLGLPLQTVKIDTSIAWSYFKDGNRVLLHLLGMFADTDLQVVVEGVETEEMAAELMERGVDFLQGYYFARPLPPEEFEAYLLRHLPRAVKG